MKMLIKGNQFVASGFPKMKFMAERNKLAKTAKVVTVTYKL